ncbi:MAG: hypothetical protein WD850_00810 [Candidatus Spechtbacterales bacterium]
MAQEALVILILVSAARLLVPLAILRWPLFGLAATIALDFYDFGVFQKTGVFPWDYYQQWDKLLDTYYLVLLLWMSKGWVDKQARTIALALFNWRVAGVGAFLILSVLGYPFESILILTPAVFEPFFVLWIVVQRTTPRLRVARWHLAVALAIIIAIKIAHEYSTHFGTDAEFWQRVGTIGL